MRWCSQRGTLSVRVGWIFTPPDSGRRPVNFGGRPARRLGVPETECETGFLYVIPVAEGEVSPREISFAENDEYLLHAAAPIDCTYRRSEGFPHHRLMGAFLFRFLRASRGTPFPGA